MCQYNGNQAPGSMASFRNVVNVMQAMTHNSSGNGRTALDALHDTTP